LFSVIEVGEMLLTVGDNAQVQSDSKDTTDLGLSL